MKQHSSSSSARSASNPRHDVRSSLLALAQPSSSSSSSSSAAAASSSSSSSASTSLPSLRHSYPAPPHAHSHAGSIGRIEWITNCVRRAVLRGCFLRWKENKMRVRFFTFLGWVFLHGMMQFFWGRAAVSGCMSACNVCVRVGASPLLFLAFPLMPIVPSHCLSAPCPL